MNDLSVQLALALGEEIKPKVEGEDNTGPIGDVFPESASPKDSTAETNDGKKRIITRRVTCMQVWFKCGTFHVQYFYILFHLFHAPTNRSKHHLKFTKEKLRNAAKARIRRMVTEKRTRTDLQVPAWLKTEWEKGTDQKEQMAECLQVVNWDKAWHHPSNLCISSKQTQKHPISNISK